MSAAQSAVAEDRIPALPDGGQALLSVFGGHRHRLCKALETQRLRRRPRPRRPLLVPRRRPQWEPASARSPARRRRYGPSARTTRPRWQRRHRRSSPDHHQRRTWHRRRRTSTARNCGTSGNTAITCDHAYVMGSDIALRCRGLANTTSATPGSCQFTNRWPSSSQKVQKVPDACHGGTIAGG